MNISTLKSAFDVSMKIDGRVGEFSFRDADLVRSQANLSGQFNQEITIASPDMPQIDSIESNPTSGPSAAGCSIDIEV